MRILGLKALSSSTTKSVALSTGQRFIQWIALSTLRRTGARSYFLVYQLRCTSCTDQVITEEYSGGNHFIIIADRPPRRQTFSHLLLIRSKSTLLLEERILKLMIRALHDCACNTVLLKTVIYSTGSLRAFSNRVLVFIFPYSHASQIVSNFVLGFLFPRLREQVREDLGNEFSHF